MDEEQDYADTDLPPPRRVPWFYVAATFVSLAIMAAPSAITFILGIRGWGLAMFASELAWPTAAIVVVWGVLRLWIGEGHLYPDLRWLVCLPIVGVIVACLAGV